jgi:MoaA/NifB/PqqE/SkfB family radical SAM enzyme
MSYINIDNLNVINVELTDYCNAACPMCSRFKWDGTLYTEKVNKNHTTLELIQDKISLDVIRRLKKFYSVGTYGDPLMNPDTTKIYEYIRKNNENCLLEMHTNAGGRDEEFWKLLARTGVKVFFSIDGLEDTNHLYRRNVNWDKLISNVKAFIAEGGSAHWKFIVFLHNEHQIEQARKLSNDLGFKTFGVSYSDRWKEFNWQTGEIKDITKWPVEDYFIEKPKSQENKYYEKRSVKVLPEQFNLLKKIECKAASNENYEIYLRANGFVQPCCMLGDIDVHQSRFLIRNFDSVNLNKSSLEDILNGKYFKELQNGIAGSKSRLKNCFYTCGVES